MAFAVPSHRTLTLALAAGGALLLVAGCGLHNPYPAGSFERGAHYAENGNNVEAVQALESFVRHNPTDSLAAEAQFLKASAYMEMAEFPLAAVEFQILRKDYPVSDRVEDAFFMEGVAYLSQVGSVERDLTGAIEARRHFVRFLAEFPSSTWVPEARAHLQEISDMMVAKRMGQARVFGQLGQHEAVAITLDHILREEAGSNLIEDVIWERARVARRLDDRDTAVEMYRRLLDEYPEGTFAGRAQRNLRKLEEEAAEDA